MVKLRDFDAAVFDMDGTLTTTMEIWDRLIDNYVISKGKEPLPDLRKQVMALDMRETAVFLIEHYGIEGSPEWMIDDINDFAAEEFEKKAAPKNGIVDYLRYLKSRGIGIAVATATDRVISEPTLIRTGIYPYVDRMFTCTEEGVNKKRPDIYVKAARYFGVEDMGRCAVFEDALHCIRTVKAEGFYTVGIYEEVFRKDTEEIRSIADEFIYSYEEIERC